MSTKLGGPRGSGQAVVALDSRTMVVQALATVSGLTATATVPDVPTEGAAWPVWVQATPDGSLLLPLRHTYDVYCLLPAGYALSTVETADGLLDPVCRALWDIAIVQLAEPVSVRFDNQTTMPGIRLRILMRGKTA